MCRLWVAFLMVVSGYYWILWFTNRYTDAHETEWAMIDSALNKLLFLWFVVEFATLLTNAKRRALHDFIAATVVIRTRI